MEWERETGRNNLLFRVLSEERQGCMLLYLCQCDDCSLLSELFCCSADQRQADMGRDRGDCSDTYSEYSFSFGLCAIWMIHRHSFKCNYSIENHSDYWACGAQTASECRLAWVIIKFKKKQKNIKICILSKIALANYNVLLIIPYRIYTVCNYK